MPCSIKCEEKGGRVGVLHDGKFYEIKKDIEEFMKKAGKPKYLAKENGLFYGQAVTGDLSFLEGYYPENYASD